MLDLGCGDCVHKDICEELGFNWMGIDYSSDSSPLLGDTHSLPFDDNSFDFVLSIAVMEHVHNPFLMVQEVKRVLKSDGVLIGSVAFLEDFHGNSMYHHTRLGTYQTLKSAGLNVKVISPYEIRSDLPFISWDGPIPQVRRLFPGLPLRIKLTLLFPVYLLDYILFKLGYFIKYHEWGEEYHRKMGKAGQYAFIAANN
jgi:SAM-dependent methyltransferase